MELGDVKHKNPHGFQLTGTNSIHRIYIIYTRQTNQNEILGTILAAKHLIRQEFHDRGRRGGVKMWA
uniref:Uncharacterized protein n=1 Tax=Arundo donax TaxID=35708 RepID=A0A0A8XPR7_ARUDO